MKKRIIILATLIGIVVIGFFVGSGFSKRADVVLLRYSVSEDGTFITLETFLASSMGYIRDIKTEQHDNGVYCSFYSTFGWLNSSIGARNVFNIEVDDFCTEIYFDRVGEKNELVLKKDETTNMWVRGR